MSKPCLTILILSFNTQMYLEKCLRSVAKARQPDWEVVVVDNASSDDSAQMVHQHFPWVKLVLSKQNLGFAAGNNIALRQLKTPYVMLLNSDTELLPPYSFQPLWDIFEREPKAAVVSPKVKLANGSLDEACHRGVPNPWNALTYFTHLEQLTKSVPVLNKVFGGYHQTWKDLRTAHQIEVCTGAAMIVRSAAINQVGVLDERYRFYGEDVDWCYSFLQAGWQVWYEPAVQVLHHKNKSGIQRAPESAEHAQTSRLAHQHFFATMEQFYEKHYTQRYPRWILWIVKLGIRTISRLERSQLWLSPRRTKT